MPKDNAQKHCPTCGQKITTDLGLRIRAARVAAGMSQAEIAEKVGMSRLGYRKCESASSNPLMSTLFLIAEALNMDLRELLEYPYAANSSSQEERG